MNQRRVAIICQYFTPERGAAVNRMEFFRRVLTAHGYRVDVVTAMPNYPEGILHPGYRYRLWKCEHDNHGELLRTCSYTSPHRGALTRLANYLSFAVTSLRWLWRLKGCRVLIFSSGPMFAGNVAYAAAGLFKSRIILDIRDLWPDRVWDVGGVAASGPAHKALKAYERFLYRHAAGITCATQRLSDEVRLRAPTSVPVTTVRNCSQVSAEPGFVKPNRTRNIGDGPIRIVEAGTMGLVQDPMTLCEAARLLASRRRDAFSLHFAGSGPKAQEVQTFFQSNAVAGAYEGQLSASRLAGLLEGAHIGMVMLSDTAHNGLAVPRRLFDYAQAGLAIVYCGAGEGADILHRLQAGIVVPPGDRQRLADTLAALLDDKEQLLYWRSRSGQLMQGEFSSEQVAKRLLDTVEQLYAAQIN